MQNSCSGKLILAARASYRECVRGAVHGASSRKATNAKFLEGDRILSRSRCSHGAALGTGTAAAGASNREGKTQSGVRPCPGAEVLDRDLRHQFRSTAACRRENTQFG